MSGWRSILLSVFPFLGPVHRAAHAGREQLRRGLNAVRASGRRAWFNRVWEPRIRREAARASGSERPVVHLYAVCWNEERIIPWFLAHYVPFVERIVIYDNGSTDGTRELLSRCPRVEIRHFDTGGKRDEVVRMGIRNSAWKESAGKADFVIVCDMDEFLWHPRMPSLLAVMKKNGFTVLKPQGWQMVADRLPDYVEGRQLTELVFEGVEDGRNFSKTVLFDPNRIREIHFGPGSHRSSPEGKVKIFSSDGAKLLHYTLRDTALWKLSVNRGRIAEADRTAGRSRHYLRTEDQVRAAWDRLAQRKVRVSPEMMAGADAQSRGPR